MYGVFVAVADVRVVRGVMVIVVKAEVENDTEGVAASPSVLPPTLLLGVKGGWGVGAVPVLEMEEVEFEGPMGLPSVLLELTLVLWETELVELLVAGPISVLLLLLAGALGVQGRYGYGAGPEREDVVALVESGTDGEVGPTSVEEDGLPLPVTVMVVFNV